MLPDCHPQLRAPHLLVWARCLAVHLTTPAWTMHRASKSAGASNSSQPAHCGRVFKLPEGESIMGVASAVVAVGQGARGRTVGDADIVMVVMCQVDEDTSL